MDRSSLCNKYFMSVKQENQGTARYLGFPLRCKSWDCPHCRQIKAAEYRDRIGKLFLKPQLYFYTLTYFHDISPEVAWSTYNAAWNRLRTNLRKQFGAFSFCRVLESHSNSPYPHLHIIADVYIPPKKLHAAAVSAGFGYQIVGKKITGTGAANYITKYLTKDWSNEKGKNLRKANHCRLISFSADIASVLPPTGECEVLGIHDNLVDCRDRIGVEWQWAHGVNAHVSYEKMSDKQYEITIVFGDIRTGQAIVQT